MPDIASTLVPKAIVMDDDWYAKEGLHRAASSGDGEKIKSLLDAGLPINAFDDDLSRTPLHHAASEGHVTVIAPESPAIHQ